MQNTIEQPLENNQNTITKPLREIVPEYKQLMGVMTKEEILALAQTRAQTITQTPSEPKPRYETMDGPVGDFGRTVAHTGYSYARMFGNPQYEGRTVEQHLQAIEAAQDARSRAERTPERQAEVDALGQELADAKGFWPTAKAGAKLLGDALTNPQEWRAGNVAGMFIDPLNAVPVGSGATIAAKMGGGLLARVAGGVAAGAVVNTPMSAGQAAAFSAARDDKTIEDVYKEAVVAGESGLAFGGIMGGVGGTLARGANAPSHSVEIPTNKPGRQDTINEALRNDLLREVELTAAAEEHSATAAATGLELAAKLAAEGKTPQEVAAAVNQALTPTEQENYVSTVLNDGAPLDPRLAGFRAAQLVENTIAARPYPDGAHVYARMQEAGGSDEMARAAAAAYEANDPQLFRDWAAEKMADNGVKLLENNYKTIKEQLPITPIEAAPALKKGFVIDDVSGVREAVTYKLVPAEEVRTSFITGEGWQFRSDRNDNNIRNIRESFDADRHFGSDGMFDGIPVIDRDGYALAGNHRSAAIKGMSDEAYAEYVAGMKRYYPDIPLEPGGDRMMLVRVIETDDVDALRRIATVSNDRRVKGESEKVVLDAAKYHAQLNTLPSQLESEAQLKGLLKAPDESESNRALLGALGGDRLPGAIDRYMKANPEDLSFKQMIYRNAYELHNLRGAAKQTGNPGLDLSPVLGHGIDRMTVSRRRTSDNVADLVADYEERLKLGGRDIDGRVLGRDELAADIMGLALQRFKGMKDEGAVELSRRVRALHEKALDDYSQPRLFGEEVGPMDRIDAALQVYGESMQLNELAAKVRRNEDDHATRRNLESDSTIATAGDPVGQVGAELGRRDAERGDGVSGQADDGAGRQPQAGAELHRGAGPVRGAGGDQPVYRTDADAGIEIGTAGGDDPTGGRADYADGDPLARRRDGAAGDDANGQGLRPARDVAQDDGAVPGRSTSGVADLAERQRLQQEAEALPVKALDIDNIRATLPMLFPEQHADVHFAEKRFYEAKGKGVMFTNGTGTGKTFSGLGIAKRFEKSGKKNILVVVQSEPKAMDWAADAKLLNLKLHPLRDTKDAGSGAVITTYANFRANEALTSRPWDLILYDESQSLMGSQRGESTANLQRHQQLAGHYASAFMRAREIHAAELARAQSDADRAIVNAKIAQSAAEIRERTHVVFLSASPFASHFAIRYADDFLFRFDSGRADADGLRYNSGNTQQQFMMEKFGYRMRYNKLTLPEKGVDTALMERQFNEWLKKEGALSSRVLEMQQDYSRDFVLVDSAIGRELNRGMEVFRSEKYRDLNELFKKRADFVYMNRLLEAIKARESLPRIEEHLRLGRKVFVLHTYNDGAPQHPFRLDDLVASLGKAEISSLWAEFRREHNDLYSLNLEGLRNPIDTITARFGDRVGVFNGRVKPKDRQAIKEAFNDPDSGLDILVAQIDAGGTGHSFHDTTGKRPRVAMMMGLPYNPVSALQAEGRIYRIGQQSDAVIEYPVIHQDFEMRAFGQKINARVGTVENMAMGDQARALRERFKEGYENAEATAPGLHQGRGGKEADRNIVQTDAFDMARSYYFARAKKNAGNKAEEGVDFYPTPEPLGLKMVEWAGIRPGESALEPSAGDGAIARWFPESADAHFVEPSTKLSARLSVQVKGRVHDMRFEDLNIINKYDVIVMNPPFGQAGATAMAHLQKAARHLREGGRIVALVPDGAFRGKFEKWFGSSDADGLYMAADISLPPVTFERAATKAKTSIVVIDKGKGSDAPPVRRDLNADNIEDLFDRLRDMSLPERPAAQSLEAALNLMENKLFDYKAEEGGGVTLGFSRYVSKGVFGELNAEAKKHGGAYSKEARGFSFPDEAAATEFLKKVEC